jgi:hypothetical protein
VDDCLLLGAVGKPIPKMTRITLATSAGASIAFATELRNFPHAPRRTCL